MIKIETIKGVDGEVRIMSDLHQWFKDLINYDSGRIYKSPKTRLNELLARKVNQERQVIDMLLEEFDSILIKSPEELQDFRNLLNGQFPNIFFNRNSQTDFGKEISWCFNYSYFRNKRLVEYAERLNIKTCPYCNSQYTLNVGTGSSKLGKFQFDHFFPKEKYPYLSLSMYNLIPVCANCNLSKGSKDYTLQNFFHPYHSSFNDSSVFQVVLDDEIGLLIENADQVNINLSNINDPKVAEYKELFKLSEIYGRHGDIVNNLYLMAKVYTEDRINELLNIQDINGEPILIDKATIYQMILCNYPKEEDINKRPLAKFTIDIARQAGLIE